MLLKKWLRGCCLYLIHNATASRPRASVRADTQLAKGEGEREMREVAARAEEDTDAEIQALTQKCAASPHARLLRFHEQQLGATARDAPGLGVRRLSAASL